jgi:transposase
MKAYSLDLREKIVESVKKDVPKSETARRFGVDRATLKRYCKQLDERGTLEPRKAPGKKAPKLDEKARKLLVEDLQQRPWATCMNVAERPYGGVNPLRRWCREACSGLSTACISIHATGCCPATRTRRRATPPIRRQTPRRSGGQPLRRCPPSRRRRPPRGGRARARPSAAALPRLLGRTRS